MSGSVNKFFGIGLLGRDAELRFTTSGVAVCTVSLAMNEQFTTKTGAKKEETTWIDVVIWGKTAETLEPYLKQGKQICVEGRLQNREWSTKDGQKQKRTEVRADRVTLLGGADSPRGAKKRPAEATEPEETFDDDNVPF